MRQPPKDAVWIHVNRLDEERGLVWAVQHWQFDRCVYEEVPSVVMSGTLYTQFFGRRGKQPRAVIEIKDARVVRGPLGAFVIGPK